MFQNVTIVLRTLILAAFVGLAGWWTVFLRDQIQGHREELQERDQRIEDLSSEVRARDEQIHEKDLEIGDLKLALDQAQQRVRELEVSMWLLKVNHRVARVEVLEQTTDPERPERARTRVRFVELDPQGAPMGEPREIEVQGRVLYIDGLVIKFEDDFVEGGDVLRGTSVALFRRVFSEHQAPNEGIELDRPQMHPLPHRDDAAFDPFYEDLWERFWDYANDPELASSKGVRAMHGEAPSIELRPGKSYRVELRASGGLSISPER